MPNSSIKTKTIFEFSGGIVARVVDLLLVSIYYGFEFASAGYGNEWRTEVKARGTLSELNYKSLKRAARYLKQEGLVRTLKDKLELPEITEKGRKKIDHTIPIYNKRRRWDGRFYIITYDIPEKQNAHRNALRRYLREIGCGLLQQSVWISPYNPTKAMSDFAEKYKLEGLIIVSSIGKDGAIGEMKVNDIMESMFDLDKINLKYKKFIVRAGLGRESRHSLLFNYLSILKEDPQIPFDLLPQGWLGDNAYQVFRKLIR